MKSKNIIENIKKMNLTKFIEKFIEKYGVFKLLIIIIVNFVLIYFLYQGYLYISYKIYIKQLENEFNKLKNIGWNVRNYRLDYLDDNKKKHIMNQKKIQKIGTIFRNKNALGVILTNHIVIDFDSKDGVESADFLRNKMPTDTVIEKTPNGYHYFFENDLNVDIPSYVQLKIHGKPVSLDILGKNHLVTMTPTIVNNKQYYWINNPYNYKCAKLSDYKWILDLTKESKPFNNSFSGIDYSISLKNAFIIANDINIESDLRFKLGNTKNYIKKMKFLNGMIYNYDDNYYFLTRVSFKDYNNKKNLFDKLYYFLKEMKVSCIIDLSVIYSNHFSNENIIQIDNCVIDNDYKQYKNYKNFEDYIKCDNLLIKTNKYTNNTITISNINNTYFMDKINTVFNHSLLDKNKIMKNNIGSESVYLSIMLANKLNISCCCLAIVKKPLDKTQSYSRTIVEYFFLTF